jgi:hypothetical protein
MANMAARELKREMEKGFKKTFQAAATEEAEKVQQELGFPQRAKDFKPGDFIRDTSFRRGQKFSKVAKIHQCTSPHGLHFEIQNGPTWCVNEEDWFSTK